MLDIAEFQEEVYAWSIHNFGNKPGTEHRPLLGAVEELGELAHAHLKIEQGIRTNEDHLEAKYDAVGDIIIYLADYCSRNKINMGLAIIQTWDKVKRRDWKANPVNGESTNG